MTHKYCMSYVYCTRYDYNNSSKDARTRYTYIDLKEGIVRYVCIDDETGEIIDSIVAEITELKDRFDNKLTREGGKWHGPYMWPQDITEISHIHLLNMATGGIGSLTGLRMNSDVQIPVETFFRAVGVL